LFNSKPNGPKLGFYTPLTFSYLKPFRLGQLLALICL